MFKCGFHSFAEQVKSITFLYVQQNKLFQAMEYWRGKFPMKNLKFIALMEPLWKILTWQTTEQTIFQRRIKNNNQILFIHRSSNFDTRPFHWNQFNYSVGSERMISFPYHVQIDLRPKRSKVFFDGKIYKIGNVGVKLQSNVIFND